MGRETDALLDSGVGKSYEVSLNDDSVLSSTKKARPTASKHKSMPGLGLSSGAGSEFTKKFDGGGLPTKSYSISAGQVSYLTPVQMGRSEMYEILPYTAVFGLQKKERNLRRAYASYAANLDIKEAEQKGKKKLTEKERSKRFSQSATLLLDELDMDKVMVTSPLIFALFVASMAQFLVGYNTGVMNAPENVVFKGHSILQWSLAVAAFAVGGPFGAMIGGTLADGKGRRGALLICIWIFLVGGAIQTAAFNMYWIIASRFVIGFASGLSSVLVPIYLGELAPPALRGTLGTLTQFALVIGILISNFLGFVFATEKLWRALFAVTPLIALGQLLCAPFLLESPRWILGQDSESKEARAIIKSLRGMRFDYEVETEAHLYISASKAQAVDATPQKKSAKKGAFMEVFSDKRVQKLVVSALLLQMAQQLCGINAVFYYSTMFFDGVIANPLVGTTIVGGVNVIATYIALLLMDSYGRRTLLLFSSGGMFVCCVVIVMALLGMFPNMVALAAVNLYVSFFEIGLGPIPWLIVAEMFDAKYVTTVMSACSQLNWVCNFIIGLVFPIMNNALGAYSFVPFAIVLLLAFAYTMFCLPETQGTTPEELQAQLEEKHKGTEYGNINIEASVGTPIDMDWVKAMQQMQDDDENGV